ncbi:MAG: alpha-glucosidase [Sphingomonadales bacterium]|nr:alpha-glucosidase [Sphingomonadales bacterium]
MISRRDMMAGGTALAALPKQLAARDSSPVVAADAAWWQSAVGYQIYPASFCDSNGDGIGDIPGIISQLDHLADLGIGFIWLSPVYASPMVDNGYDISDYRAINPRFGTLADMDRLIAEARQRRIGIVMDLVVNHTSDQHPWFAAAASDPASPWRDFYIWRADPPAPGSPADMPAAFGGRAWSRAPSGHGWYFHQFAPQQPDLNWANPALRAEVHAMMNWWLDRGVAGFRMDVIDLIGKDPEHGITTNGPHLHDYLQEMNRATLRGRDAVTVGEAWSATLDNAPLYCAPERHELAMVFQFSHVLRFLDAKAGKWKPRPIDLPTLKADFAAWQQGMHGRGWNSLFWGNHDLPRAVSRYGDDGVYRVASAKALATVLHLMEGTPYIYQGEEIGMTNAGFTRIDQYRDLETLNGLAEQRAAGMSDAEFLAAARVSSRDNARTPMQWSAAPHAGFTSGTPWIELNANYPQVNVAADRAGHDGVFDHYRRLIALRRSHAIIRHGSFRLRMADHGQVFAYERQLGSQRLLVTANLSAHEAPIPLAEATAGTDLLTGRATVPTTTLAPYQAEVILLDAD